MATQTGPRLRVEGSCEGCAHLITDARDPRLGRGPHAACVHPSRANGGLIFARARGPWPMPSGCPELPAARLALLVDLARTICRKCGRTVEPERECYAIPTCFACLPPPPRIPFETIGEINEQAIASMKHGDKLTEITGTPGEHITVEAGESGWIVRLGIGGVTLAKSARRAMVYVRERRRLAKVSP